MLAWLIVFLVTVVTYLVCFKPYQFWKNLKVPSLKIVPLIGNGVSMIFRRKTMHEWIKDIYESSKGRYIGLYQFNMPILMIRDLDLIKKLGVKDFDYFTDHQSFLDENVDPLFGKNLFAMKGDSWRNMRSTLSPAFTSSKMRAMFNLISECAEQYTKYFLKLVDKNGKPIEIEMKDTYTRFANDVIASTAFGIQCNSIEEKDNEFYLMGKDATNFGGVRSLKFIGYALSKTLMKWLNVKVFSEEVCIFFTNIIKTTLATREEQGIVRPDMIHLLMEARKGKLRHDVSKDEDAGFATVVESEVGKSNGNNKIVDLSDEVITAQALLFFIAGFDTISTAMCQMSYELALNDDIQQKLLDEIDATLENCNGKLSYEVVLKMKYLDMVLSETLRKWPAVPVLDRVCVNSYTIPAERPEESPVKLPKGTLVWFPAYAIHRDPQYYSEPEKFDPERFSEENKHNIQPMAYLPFGVGPRNCIGSRFALMEAKIIFIHLLSKFSFTLIEKSQVPLKFKKGEFNMTAERGFWLGLKRRNN